MFLKNNLSKSGREWCEFLEGEVTLVLENGMEKEKRGSYEG